MTAGRRSAASVLLFCGAPIPAMCPGAGAQDKARDDEALGLVRLLGQVDIVLAHFAARRARLGGAPPVRLAAVPGAAGYSVYDSMHFSGPRPPESSDLVATRPISQYVPLLGGAVNALPLGRTMPRLR